MSTAPQASGSGGNGRDHLDFGAYVQASGLRLKRIAFLLTGDPATSEDLLQTAYAKVLPHWDRVVASGDPDAYLRQVMVNIRTSWWRRRRSHESLVAAVPEPDRDGNRVRDVSEAQADLGVLLAALRALPRGQQVAVVLRHYCDLSEAETAAVMGISVGSVKSQTSRARATLRAESIDDVRKGMTMSPEIDPLDRALADLAATVDQHQPGDRLPAVRALARRRARRRAVAVAAAGLTVVALIGLGVRSTGRPPAQTQIPATPTSSGPAGPTTASTAKASASVASPPPSPSRTDSPSAVPVDWLNRTYPVDCGERHGPLTFTDGRARLLDLKLTAFVSSGVIVEQDTRRAVPVAIVAIGCLEADRAYRTVLVYQQLEGHALLGTVVGAAPPTWVFDVKVVDGRVVTTALGWSPAAVWGAADRLVTTTAMFASSGVTVSTRAAAVTMTVRADGRVVAVGQGRQVVIPDQSVPPGQQG